MKVLMWSVIIFIFIFTGVFLDRTLAASGWPLRESFASYQDGSTLEDRVMTLYNTVLKRQPSSKEMIDATRNLTNGTWTESGLRQRLIDSEEYQRMIKLQSNELAPELQKMVADRATIQRISMIYQEERKTTIPPSLVLPLKDVYIMLDYNEYAFRAFLRHNKIEYFEQDVQSGASSLDKETLQAYIEKEMGPVDTFVKEGEKLAQVAAEEAAKATSASPSSTVAGASMEDKVCRTIHDKDSDMTPAVNDILARSEKVFSKDEAAKMLDQQAIETYQIPTKLHYGQMVLRPDMSWTVPHQHPPVCTSLGQKSLTQPVMTNSKLLLGTPLEDVDAAPLMPSFEYKEFVPVQVQGEPSGNATS